MIKVLFFGPVAERVGCRELSEPVIAGQTVADLQQSLQVRYPQAFELVCFVALNGEQVVDLNTPLPTQAEVVFMSKFSGG